MYGVPSPINESLEHWVAVNHTWEMKDHLFNYKTTEGRIKLPTESREGDSRKKSLELILQDVVTVLTVGQRCADWFTLREFRLTSTTAASLLLKCGEYREWMNLPVSEVEEPNPSELLARLSKGWFRFGRATDDMKRGTMNEDAVLSMFRQSEFIEEVFNVGMLCRKAEPWIGCSVDGIAIFNGELAIPGLSDSMEDTDDLLAVVEIKTAVGNARVARATHVASRDLIVCNLNSAVFQERVPQEHAAQIVHHCTTLNIEWFFYICASESQILFTVLSYCPTDVRHIAMSFYSRTVSPALRWAHSSPMEQQPKTTDKHTDDVISSRVSFWKMLNTEVSSNGPFVPVRIFKHSSQTIYNKTKGGVDGNAQSRAILKCSTDSLKWEQKVVTQVFKSIAVNSWVAWRHLQRKELLEKTETFKGLDQYRNALNKVESFPDYVFEVAQELLTYAENLDKESTIDATSVRRNENERRMKKPEIKRLIAKAKARKCYKVTFFNSSEGVALRLKVGGHDHTDDAVKYCALCGGNNKSEFRGHRSRVVCKVCNVHLCVKIRHGFRRSCWDVWHTVKTLKSRRPQAINSSNTLEEESEDQEIEQIKTRAQSRAQEARNGSKGASRSEK